MSTECKRIITHGGTFKLNSYTYGHTDLLDFKGQFVSVEYDYKNPASVRVYELKGKAICVASRTTKIGPDFFGIDITSPGFKPIKQKITDLPDFIVHSSKTKAHAEEQFKKAKEKKQNHASPDMQRLFNKFKQRARNATNLIERIERGERVMKDDIQVALMFRDLESVSSMVREYIEDELSIASSRKGFH